MAEDRDMDEGVKAGEPSEAAQALVDELFTSGSGERADRLVLTARNGWDLGGWGEGPVRDKIALALDAARAEGRRAGIEEAALKVRADCGACEDGVFDHEPDRAVQTGEGEEDYRVEPGDAIECQYCGEPMRAIRALLDTETP